VSEAGAKVLIERISGARLRAPRPDDSTGFDLSKIWNLQCWTKNPARWGSRGGANQESALSHRALGESYHRIRAERSSKLKFNESCRWSFPGT
jgi:hypothetical protein